MARREERKVVRVVFADLVGSTERAEGLDPEDVRALLSRYHARARHELERHGGTVEKFIGDAVVAVFGAPVAHDDDPERAVRAAFALVDAVAELGEDDAAFGLEVRVGINTGETLVSLDSRPHAGEARMMAVEIAAAETGRFEQAALDSVIATRGSPGRGVLRGGRCAVPLRTGAQSGRGGRREGCLGVSCRSGGR